MHGSELDNSANIPVQWNPLLRILFRFVFVYLFFFIFPFPVTYVPIVSYVALAYQRVLQPSIIWFSTSILNFPLEPLKETGSGDGIFRYIEILFYLILATLGTVIWTALDYRRKNYQTLHDWLRFYVRLFLGTTLVGYGVSKVIPTQFGPPSLSRLVETYGESSPMGLLWTFMGASPAYTIFTGAVELVAGVLLFFAQTTLLGALISLAAFTNIFMLNMSYDVPVKIFSFHYLLLSIFLLLPDAIFLFRLFILRQPAELSRIRPLFKKAILNRIIVGFEIGCVLLFTIGGLYGAHYLNTKYSAGPDRPKLYGIWSVSEFAINGVKQSVLDDPGRWRTVIFEYPKNASITYLSGEKIWLRRVSDPKTGEIKLQSSDGVSPRWEFRIKILSDDAIEIAGSTGTDSIKAKLRKLDHTKFLLINRGFNWVNETPFNR